LKDSQKGRLRQVWLVLALFLVFFATAWGNAIAAEYTMKVGHATLKDAQDQTAILFAKEVERLSGGKIKAPVFGASQLGNNPKMNKDVLAGIQEAIVQPASFSAPYIPVLGVLDLPGLFPNPDLQAKILSSDDVLPLKKAAQEVGLEIVAFFWGGPKALATTFSLKTAEDLKGRKIRVMQSPELVAGMKAMGAIGVAMPLSECYTALQQGVVEGFEGSPDVIHKFKMYEPAKYIANTNHGSLSTFIAVNKKWLDSLPADLQAAVRQAGRIAEKQALPIYKEYQGGAWEKMKAEKGVLATEFSEQEREKLRALAQGAWVEVRKDKAKEEVLNGLIPSIKAAQ